MEKFGKFGASGMLGEWYEGDYMVSDKQFVKIYKKGEKLPNTNHSGPDREIASIHLDKGEYVRALTAGEGKRLQRREEE